MSLKRFSAMEVGRQDKHIPGAALDALHAGENIDESQLVAMVMLCARVCRGCMQPPREMTT